MLMSRSISFYDASSITGLTGFEQYKHQEFPASGF